MKNIIFPLSKNNCFTSPAWIILRGRVLSPGLSTCAVEVQHLFLDEGCIS